MPKKVLVILAKGFEEVEAIAPIDILRRAGIEVVIAGLDKLKITGFRGITVEADKILNEVDDDFDAIVLPGGMPGAKNLAESNHVREIISEMNSSGKIIAAICAAPVEVLNPMGILDNKSATCFPSRRKDLNVAVNYREEKVIVDGNIITSQGFGTAIPFGLEIVQQLLGRETKEKVSNTALL